MCRPDWLYCRTKDCNNHIIRGGIKFEAYCYSLENPNRLQGGLRPNDDWFCNNIDWLYSPPPDQRVRSMIHCHVHLEAANKKRLKEEEEKNIKRQATERKLKERREKRLNDGNEGHAKPLEPLRVDQQTHRLTGVAKAQNSAVRFGLRHIDTPLVPRKRPTTKRPSVAKKSTDKPVVQRGKP
ncbi:hypothetical protein SNOG_14373 [Parastagonospora nodorum SN15]|uniref:Uncharacterized protein n=1 Tax=Phaeosphaeria nodorum (strain SN15 / ATCC MYA-4574 / FGSC 10173) TaxID=321614 RepID=Q0U1I6_PHANO|nr:hypothetical protein SNOG_14373 [Parastagonospora nodorum SN15]EAT78244.1 hypothetical protein SNOG_14373 [Parastagonospora nodorum SN15]